MDASEQLEGLRAAVAWAGMEIEELVLPREGHVVVGRTRLHYLDWGNQGRRPVLFLHGGGLQAHTWDLVCLDLRRDFHCLALDLRGHGDSEWSPEADYSLEAYAADVAGFIDLMGLQDFVLVGMSLGGLTSICYAGHHPERLAALVLVDVGPNVRTPGAQRIRDFLAAPSEVEEIDELVRRAVSFNPLRDERVLRYSLRHNLRRLPNGKWTWKHDPRQWQGFSPEERTRRYRELWREVERISCPTLVVRGELSEVFLDEDAEKLARTLPRGRWVRVPRAGHTVQGDNPASLVRELRRFLAEVLPEGEKTVSRG